MRPPFLRWSLLIKGTGGARVNFGAPLGPNSIRGRYPRPSAMIRVHPLQAFEGSQALPNVEARSASSIRGARLTRCLLPLRG